MSVKTANFAIFVALSCVATAGLSIGLSFPLLSLTLDDWGVSAAGIGLFTLASAFSTIACTPFAPGLLGRFGTKRALVAALITISATFIVYYLAPNIPAWAGARALAGVAFSVLFVACEAWALEGAPPHRRGLVMGSFAATFAGAMALGGASVAIFGHEGPAIYLLGAAFPVVGLVALLAPSAPATAPTGAAAAPSALFARIKTAPLIMLAPLAMGAIETAKYNLVPIYARRIDLSDDIAAALISASGLGVLLLQPLVGWMADKIGARAGLILCALAGAAAPLAIAAVGPAPGAALGLMFLYSGLVTGLYTIGLIWLARRFGGEDLAAGNAAYAMSYGVGQLVGPSLAGPAFSLWGPVGFMAALSALAGLYLAVLVRARRQMA